MEDSDEFETDFSTDASQDGPSQDEPSDGVPQQAAFHEAAGAVGAAETVETAGTIEAAETIDFSVDYEHSGDRRVDDALDRLARLPDTPLPGHADVYDAVHTELRAVLSEQPAGAQGPR